MPRLPFFSFCYRPNFRQQIEDLALLARPERWDFLKDSQDTPHQILVNYINHTFMRLMELQNSVNGVSDVQYISESDDFFCFDTGLFTKNFEPIYALLVPNTPGYTAKWQLKGFYKKSSYELRKISKLPERATYFDNFEDLIYDTRLDLRINIDHILEDERNKLRIPETYRELPNLPMLFLGSAIEYAKVRIKENYKAAVPQYFNGKIQFLIPISLGNPSVVDLSLAVGKEGGIYTGHTCLTLDMAYNNARLIAKPESDWLIGK